MFFKSKVRILNIEIVDIIKIATTTGYHVYISEDVVTTSLLFVIEGLTYDVMDVICSYRSSGIILMEDILL